jgi:hypothetical protein
LRRIYQNERNNRKAHRAEAEGPAEKNGKFGGHEVGKTYYCGYWQQTYTVIDAKEGGCFGWSVVCKWQDGETNCHSTSLIPGRDFEVILA